MDSFSQFFRKKKAFVAYRPIVCLLGNLGVFLTCCSVSSFGARGIILAMCMLMTINPNVAHLRTLPESSFISYAYIHPFTAHDGITIGWKLRNSFSGLRTYDACVVLICCPSNCLMIAGCCCLVGMTWRTFGLGSCIILSLGLSREHWNIAKRLPRRTYFLGCCRVHFLENSQAYFCTLSCTSTSLAFGSLGKTQKRKQKKCYARCKKVNNCLCW